MKVIIVDDEPDMREIYAYYMKDYFGDGVDITMAEDGLRAVNGIMDFPYDLIWTDLRMPTMDGMSLIQNIRQYSIPNKETPIFVVSGDTQLMKTVKELGLEKVEVINKITSKDEYRRHLDLYFAKISKQHNRL